MKLLVGLDEHDHFFVIKYEDRSKFFITLTTDTIFNDLLSEEKKDITYEDVLKMNEEEYEDFVHLFIQRGELEIVEFRV